ncbi:hypothetical protein LSL4_gp139 [Pseudomonas phage LSL4]|nr:hypothetical protein LSL4_gp139 [Pseudomonas phage LSL4]
MPRKGAPCSSEILAGGWVSELKNVDRPLPGLHNGSTFAAR